MAFGDTIDDIKEYRRFFTGDAQIASEQDLGTPLFVWQALDQARRELQHTVPLKSAIWACQYPTGLAWRYVLGPKFRLTLYQPIEDRHLTVGVSELLALKEAFVIAATVGLLQLDSEIP